MDIWIWVHDKVSNVRRSIPITWFEQEKERFILEVEKVEEKIKEVEQEIVTKVTNKLKKGKK